MTSLHQGNVNLKGSDRDLDSRTSGNTPRRGLRGKVALVTGAGRRIGRAVALELGRAGARVAIHVHRSKVEGESLRAELHGLGCEAIVVPADQRQAEQIESACDRVEGELGGVDVLVNSAGTWPRRALENSDAAFFDEVMATNLRGPFLWSRRLGPAMKRRGWGAIVSIADAVHDRPDPAAIPYHMAKSGVVTMTHGLAKALAPEVRVNGIGPGPIVFPEAYAEEAAEADRRATLLGREGRPEDIAKAVRFLVENENITGVCLPVDGGYRFGR